MPSQPAVLLTPSISLRLARLRSCKQNEKRKSHSPYTLSSSVSCKPGVCHSYENCRVCTNNSYSETTRFALASASFSGLVTSLRPYFFSKSFPVNSFADPHPLTSVVSISYENGGGRGVSTLISQTFLSVPRCLCGNPNRCIIPPREHPPERSRMSRPGLPHRERNHHSRILSALPQRPPERLQPEIESRSGHYSRR